MGYKHTYYKPYTVSSMVPDSPTSNSFPINTVNIYIFLYFVPGTVLVGSMNTSPK